jgi:hypothetical protein
MLEGCTYIGRLEDQPQSLITILRLCGEKFDQNKIKASTPNNQSKKPNTKLPDHILMDFAIEEHEIYLNWYQSPFFDNDKETHIKLWISKT